MNGHCIRYISQEGPKEVNPTSLNPQKNRETYISPFRDQKTSLNKDGRTFMTSSGKINKAEGFRQKQGGEMKGAPFQRSRNNTNQKNDKERSQYRSAGKGVEDNRREVLKFSQIKKKLDEQMQERQKFQELAARQELKISNLQQQINKLRLQKRQLDRSLLELQKVNQENKNNLNKANQNVEQLNKSIKEMKLNQKSLNNLKNLQNQIEYLQERNKKMAIQNQELVKKNSLLKNEVEKGANGYQSENGSKITRAQTASCRSIQKRLFIPMASTPKQNEKQRFLQANLHELEKRLYEKEREMKKLQIQLNCIDRKKVMSIDEVRNKKDRQINILKQKFMKVTKDLKETKDKAQMKEKLQNKNMKDSAFLRKVKSSKHLGMTSESQEITLELSSEP